MSKAATRCRQAGTVARRHDRAACVDGDRRRCGRQTPAQIEDALNVGFAFNVITRLADTFEFEVGSPESFDAGARHLLGRGYK